MRRHSDTRGILHPAAWRKSFLVSIVSLVWRRVADPGEAGRERRPTGRECQSPWQVAEDLVSARGRGQTSKAGCRVRRRAAPCQKCPRFGTPRGVRSQRCDITPDDRYRSRKPFQHLSPALRVASFPTLDGTHSRTRPRAKNSRDRAQSAGRRAAHGCPAAVRWQSNARTGSCPWVAVRSRPTRFGFAVEILLDLG